MAYAALNIVLACYAVKAFIGLRNSVVDVCIHGFSLLYKSGRKRRRLRRKARTDQQAPRPTDWRSVLEVDFIEGEHRPAYAKPNVTTVAASAVPAQPSAAEPRRRLSLLRLVLVLAVLAGIGYGGLSASGPGCSLPSRHPPDLVRALRRRHAHADVPVPEFLGGPGTADGPWIRCRRTRIRVRAELGRRLQPDPGQ